MSGTSEPVSGPPNSPPFSALSYIRAMADNDIPMDLLEALFLSIVVHAADHVLGYRILWGLNFKFGFDWEKPSTM